MCAQARVRVVKLIRLSAGIPAPFLQRMTAPPDTAQQGSALVVGPLRCCACLLTTCGLAHPVCEAFLSACIGICGGISISQRLHRPMRSHMHRQEWMPLHMLHLVRDPRATANSLAQPEVAEWFGCGTAAQCAATACAAIRAQLASAATASFSSHVYYLLRCVRACARTHSAYMCAHVLHEGVR
jgi:hypothetical protein